MNSQNSDRDLKPTQLLSMREVTTLTTYSRPSIYRLIATCGFPSPIKMGVVKIAFRADEVEAWLSSRPRASIRVESTPEAALKKRPNHVSSAFKSKV